MAKRGMAMGATTKANIGVGRKSGLRLSSGGLGTSPFSQAKSAASKSVRKVNSEVKSKIAKAKKKGIAGKPISKRGNLLNSSPSSSSDIGIDSFRASKAKAMLEGTMRAKKRMERRIGFTGLPNTINFSERDSEWRKNLSLSLKRYWARKRPGRIEGNIGELNQAKKRYDAGESATSILLDPNLSGKTKTEIVGKKVGELRGKFDVIVDHIKDRGKDFKRGFRGSRRDIRGRNIAEKYNLDVVVPAVGAVGLGANTALALKGTGVKTALRTGDVQALRNIATTGTGVKKLPIGTRAAAVGALGLGAYSLATQIQRHRKPQVFKYRKDYSILEFARTKGAKDKNPRKRRSRRIVEGSLAGAGIGAGTAVGSGALTGSVLFPSLFVTYKKGSIERRRINRELVNLINEKSKKSPYLSKKFLKKTLIPRSAITGGGYVGKAALKNKKLMAASALAGGLYGAYKGNKRFNKENNK